MDSIREIVSTTESTLSAATSQSSSSDNERRTKSSNLYLVTFLATLFLLLFVSCAIVFRSYILRRRFQLRLDEAMAAGMLLAPRAQGSRKKRFGARPKLFDAWVADGGHTWDEMMPVSAQPIHVKRRPRDSIAKHPAVTPPDTSAASPVSPTFNPPLEHPQPFYKFWVRPTPMEPPISPGPPRIRPQVLQVAVLIRMPSQDRPKNLSTSSLSHSDEDDEDDEPLPEMAMGVARLPFKPELHQDP